MTSAPYLPHVHVHTNEQYVWASLCAPDEFFLVGLFILGFTKQTSSKLRPHFRDRDCRESNQILYIGPTTPL